MPSARARLARAAALSAAGPQMAGSLVGSPAAGSDARDRTTIVTLTGCSTGAAAGSASPQAQSDRHSARPPPATGQSLQPKAALPAASCTGSALTATVDSGASLG